MKRFIAVVFTFLPLLVSSFYVKVGILSHDLDSDTTKKIWSMAQNYSTMMSLEPVVEIAQWRDIDNAAKFSRTICNLVSRDIDALVYLGSSRWNSFISSYATSLGLPFVAAGVNDADLSQNQVCMVPDSTEAAADIIIRYKWDRFIFFYDADNGADHLQKVLSSLLSADFYVKTDGFLKVDGVSQAMYFLEHMAPSMRKHFLLATSEEFADSFINSCDSCDILLLTPVGTVKQFPHRRGNTLTKFSMVETDDPVLMALENRLKTLSSFIARGKPGKEIPDSTILHYDSSSTLNAAFNKIARENPSALKSGQSRKCFEFAEQISQTSNILKNVYIEHGASGRVTFDEKGRRLNYKFNIIQSSMYGDMEKVGTWSDKHGLQLIREPASPAHRDHEKAMPIKVTTILIDPFVIQFGSGPFQGFVVDFLDELSKEILLDYKLHVVKDGFYGKLTDGEWNGMIGELIRGEADIAIAPLTKTLQRQEVIDFSMNIMTSGLDILLKKTEPGDRAAFAPFAFLSVWSVETWIAVVIVVAIYSAGSYGISRFIGSPDRVRALESKGTDNLSPCGSVWFTVGSLFCRDTGIYPRYITHRLWALLWWIFCIFIGLLYVSMLTAALVKVRTTVTATHSRKTSQEVLKEYLETGSPVVGALTGGSTNELFTKSEIGIYQQIGRLMKENPDTMVASYKAGVERVEKSNGNYAFVMESTSSEYIANIKPCEVLVSSGYLFTRSYAVAFPKNSTIKEAINHGILSLMETGKIRELYEKWWHSQSSVCEDPSFDILPKVYSVAMTLHEVSGVFYLLILFSLLSVAAAVAEYYVRTRKIMET